jgi:hypothetical protein
VFFHLSIADALRSRLITDARCQHMARAPRAFRSLIVLMARKKAQREQEAATQQRAPDLRALLDHAAFVMHDSCKPSSMLAARPMPWLSLLQTVPLYRCH